MDKIYFTVNGDKVALSGSEVTPDTSLNDYIRNYLNLHGTKAMCHEGGCGACVVSVSQTHPTTGEKNVFAVNSCLVHVLSCHDWNITTVEGAGNRKDGYHPLQKRLAEFNGTQCGYCTPGWVMNMYSQPVNCFTDEPMPSTSKAFQEMSSPQEKKISDMVYETMKLIEEKKIVLPQMPELKKKRLARRARDTPKKRIKTGLESRRTFKTAYSYKKRRGRTLRKRPVLSDSDSMTSFGSRGSSQSE